MAKAFIRGWTSRYGLATRIYTDNGSCFTSNLFQEIQNQLGIEVHFVTPYHQQTNSVERFHKTLKNSLKAHLVEMGDTYQNKWMQRLPWCLLGYRIRYQPALDASAAQMVLGTEISVPGSLICEPGDTLLSKTQVHKLLHELHKKSAIPCKPMSRHGEQQAYMPDETKYVTLVYIRDAKAKPLSQKFLGPFFQSSSSPQTTWL